ncbi:helix-turn-helix transcriptional regulator [Haloechinothrix sp. YIM 98757]|uniref:Helix-turn-helix transcriptional regulator n=1 Tax=Haloechinothrix aidingensis TaxID=2752311 RepID=A0A838A6Y7_9PSEU|nr:helix-turn-helix transcriptional regulator [Haloechinothrix aidingensis]MBA0124918.1 helix-turn-helix transcriptional regulator [Haloechinothrix aidingensis]
MTRDPGVDALIRQWSAERDATAEDSEVNRITAEWLADAPSSAPGIPGQRDNGGDSGWSEVQAADPRYVEAMRRRLPGVPEELLGAAARWWQVVGGLAEAEEWWDAGISPLDQRALEYRAAGLAPGDLSVHLGPYTVLEHLRRGSAAAWCVARLAKARRAAAS